MELLVKKRNDLGKRASRRLRRSKEVPAVIYCAGKVIENISFIERDFNSLFKVIRGNEIAELNLDGKIIKALVKKYEYNYVKDNIVHVDFLAIEKNRAIKVNVPVKILGVSKGIKLGGILDLKTRAIKIQCDPDNILDFIDVDITELDLNQTMRIKDLNLENMQVLMADNHPIVSILASRLNKKEETN